MIFYDTSISPSYCLNRLQLNLFLDAFDKNEAPKIVISEGEKNNWNDDEKYIKYNNLLIQNKLYNLGLNEEYFNTNIENKNVYCHKIFYQYGLPLRYNMVEQNYHTQHIWYDKKYHIYKVVDKDNDIYVNSSDRTITKINFIDEKTLGELYENCWKYELNISTNEYERLPEETAKSSLVKYILYKTIFEYCGNPYDRIADYGRLILFLLSKANLTENEKNILQPLMQYAPNINDLTNVLEREKCIQGMVKDAKTDVRKFLQNT